MNDEIKTLIAVPPNIKPVVNSADPNPFCAPATTPIAPAATSCAETKGGISCMCPVRILWAYSTAHRRPRSVTP